MPSSPSPVASYVEMSPPPNGGGYFIMALLAVIITTVFVSLAGLFASVHSALALKPTLSTLLSPPLAPTPRRAPEPVLITVLEASALLAACLAIVLLCALIPPSSSSNYSWVRGQVLFALAFAPLGCLTRFYLSTVLNGKLSPSFPLGTFVVNLAGTVVMVLAWDLAHANVGGGGGGGLIGCLVLQGIEDGFRGCLTTVSTWVVELAELALRRRRHAYVYGFSSVFGALVPAIAIMASSKWSHAGNLRLLCTS